MANVWRLNADANSLGWYDIDLQTNGKTVKHLLDELIPRQRAVGYYVTFDNTVDQIVVNVFSFANADIPLPNGQTLGANPNQRTLNFEQALDVTDAVISETAISKYHRIIARGEKRTTTFTTRIQCEQGPTAILCAAWSSGDEIDYQTASSTASDYAGLTLQQQQARNAIYRSAPRLEEVYRRYTLNQNNDPSERWNGIITDPLGVVTTQYGLRCDQTLPTFTGIVGTSDPRDYVPALRVTRALPLYESVDWSGTNIQTFVYSSAFPDNRHPSFMAPFVFGITTQAVAASSSSSSSIAAKPARYEMLDRLQRSWVAAGDRTWSAKLSVLDTEPGIEIHATVPHFLATAAATAFAAMADHENLSTQKGIPYTDCFATICVELTEHIQVDEVLEVPPTNAPEQVLILNVPNARHDWVVPYTVVDIRDGLPVQTISGGLAKNDYARLATIAQAAAQWYSQERQTLELSYRQLRGLFQLGQLITDVGSNYDKPAEDDLSSSSSSSSSASVVVPNASINTPITSITYNLGKGNTPGFTKVETGFASFDLV